MEELARVVDLLKAAQKLAEESKAADILVYLIAMAVTEGEHQIKSARKRH